MRLTAVDKPAAWSVMRVLRWQRCCSCSWYLQPLRASRSCRSSQSMACSACHTLTTLHALLTELHGWADFAHAHSNMHDRRACSRLM